MDPWKLKLSSCARQQVSNAAPAATLYVFTETPRNASVYSHENGAVIYQYSVEEESALPSNYIDQLRLHVPRCRHEYVQHLRRSRVGNMWLRARGKLPRVQEGRRRLLGQEQGSRLPPRRMSVTAHAVAVAVFFPPALVVSAFVLHRRLAGALRASLGLFSGGGLSPPSLGVPLGFMDG